MIRKILGRLMGNGSGGGDTPDLGRRQAFRAEETGIDPDLVDERAVQVVRTLKEAGHEAYVVGGAVRDLLLGLRPKDFDVSTSATPEQVKSLFRRAFIVGRRFRIVHVVFGRSRERQVFEVTTFRANLDHEDAQQIAGNERTASRRLEGVRHAVGRDGRVLRDNVWGSLEEDAVRRDFTINALYYDPQEHELIDYHGGMADIKARRLRMIGDPMQRYREDPVRVIRAVRFAAKLGKRGFKLDRKTAAPLVEAAELLDAVPQSRLFHEMIKLLQTGHAVASVEQLRALGLARGVYPLLDLVVERADTPFVHAALVDTDRRVGEGKPVAPSFLLACVLWQDVQQGWQERLAQDEHRIPALHDAIAAVFDSHIGDISGRGKIGADMRETWLLQPRFEQRRGRSPYKLVDQPRFRASFDFLRLRAETGDTDPELADWWERFSSGDDATREELVGTSGGDDKPRRRRRRKPRNSAGNRPQEEDGTPVESAGNGDDAPIRRPRRRRRKPASSQSPDRAAPRES